MTSEIPSGHRAKVFLGLGSNLGDRVRNLGEARRQLERSGIRLEELSPIYVTEPVDFREQDWFLNQVVRVSTPLEPSPLLELCLNIERTMGRKRQIPKGPRNIDIDILLYGELVLETEALTVPHPRLSQRRFILEPLATLAPDLMHPVLKSTISSLLRACPDRSQVYLFRD
jgi:2-amino-4-hydroxy-6-hydroxymethyldihydropteridine diphosphokinase